MTPVPGVFEVSRDDVLARRNALLAEADDFRQFPERNRPAVHAALRR
ncbi:MAG TPA: hypothetical protein VIY28_04860 [Pseudonocardiaceae bacterium]